MESGHNGRNQKEEAMQTYRGNQALPQWSPAITAGIRSTSKIILMPTSHNRLNGVRP